MPCRIGPALGAVAAMLITGCGTSSGQAQGTVVTATETGYKIVVSQASFTPGTYTFVATRAKGSAFWSVMGCWGATPTLWDGWWSRMPGPGFRIIAPSRFGYFGSSLPPGATRPGMRTRTLCCLDHLGVGRVVALGFSAGGGSALEFGLRHPDQVIELILANCRPTGSP
jgi:hypothetical protein